MRVRVVRSGRWRAGVFWRATSLLLTPLSPRSAILAPAAGPFNSWDRDPAWFTDPVTGAPTTTKQMDEISNNFIIANYNSLGAIDNDDGV